MFQFLPYGASAKIICTKSSKKGQLVSTYTSSTNYTTSYQEIGLNGSYFLLSNKEPVEMEYSYSSNNGKLVEIITNFEVIADEVNIRNNGNGHYAIINQTWLNNGSGSFKISNEAWFNNGRQEEPYIKLCFNKIQVECCFTNPWHGLGGNYCDNGWKALKLTDNNTRLQPGSESAQNYCSLSRYFTISWNQSESTQLFFSQFVNDVHWYQIWFSYMDANENIIDFDGTRNGIRVNEIKTHRLWSHDQSGNTYPTYTATLPPLNGSGNISGVTPYNYFKIGYTINFAGESSWQPASTLSINENNYNYDSVGFIYKQTINSNINSSNSSPVLYSHPSTNNWSSNSKFYKTSNGKYVSPSDGLQINSTWTTGSYCIPYTPCDCYSCDCYSCDCYSCDCDCDSCDGGSEYPKSGRAIRNVGLWSNPGASGTYKGGVMAGDYVTVSQEYNGNYYIYNQTNGAEGWGALNPL